MITLDGYNDINQVLKYKGDYIFVNKEDIKLSDNEYLNEDIIGLNVYLDGELLGVVTKIENHNGNEVLYINGLKHYIIPYNFDIIISVDLKEKKMHVKNIPGLF
jgi:16S rRNA processing protein RimM